jgi:hypothetical protein
MARGLLRLHTTTEDAHENKTLPTMRHADVGLDRSLLGLCKLPLRDHVSRSHV